MKRLVFSIHILAAVVCSSAVLAAPASADIIPKCQHANEIVTKQYVTQRSTVYEVPNTNGKIHATLPAGSTIYTSELLRDHSINPEKWYLLFPTENLPPILGCIAGFIHPSLVSKTPPPNQTQQASGSGSGGKWVALVSGYLEPDGWRTEADMFYVLAWNWPSRQAAIDAVIRRCRSKGGYDCEHRARASDEFPCVGGGFWKARYSVASGRAGHQVRVYTQFFESESRGWGLFEANSAYYEFQVECSDR